MDQVEKPKAKASMTAMLVRRESHDSVEEELRNRAQVAKRLQALALVRQHLTMYSLKVM